MDLAIGKLSYHMLDFKRKRFLLLSPGGAMGQNVTGKQATGLNYSREIYYACAKITPSMLRVFNIGQIAQPHSES
jgi:hypothetical protein